MPGTLYLVATPIGNLQDITMRGLDTLRSVDLIACEDTRHTRNLLNFFRISNRLISYHEHNETERAEELIDRLMQGDCVAVVSDAGTPGICDPGSRVVRQAVEAGITVVPIPGAVAFVNAVVASGLPIDSIFFGGFLPSRKGDRRKRLLELREVPATLVLYEAPHRIAKALGDCLEIFGDRRSAVARELTKLHEEFIRGTLSELRDRFLLNKTKGEMVIVIDRAAKSQALHDIATISSRVQELEEAGMDPKTALKKAAKEFGLSKSEAYRLVRGKN